MRAASRPRLYTREFGLACLIHFAGGMSLSMFVLFPLHVRRLGGDETDIGLLLGIGTAASVLARPAVGSLLDRLGTRRVLVWGAIANTLSYVPFPFLERVGAGAYAATIAHDVVWGVLFAGFFTYAADLAPAGRRAEAIAMFGVPGILTNGLGPTLGEALIARAGFAGLYVGAGAFSLVSLALLGLVPRRAPTGTRHEGTGLAPMRDAIAHGALGPLLGATAALGVAINAAFFFVAPFSRDLGIERTAPFFLSYAATSMAVRLTGRRLLGTHAVAVPAFAVYAAGLAALCFLPEWWMLVAGGIGCGAGHGTLFPALTGLAVERVPARLSGTAVSLVTAVLDLGAVVGTPLCGAVAETWGYPAMFTGVAAIAFGGLALVAYDRRVARVTGAR